MRAAGLAAAMCLLAAAAHAQSCFCLSCAFSEREMFRAASSSMMPTLMPGRCFVTDRTDATQAPPRRGEVIVFRHPVAQDAYVFRLIGLPGDTVQIRAGRLWLNGTGVPTAPAPDFVVPDDVFGPGCPPGPRAAPCTVTQILETLPGGQSYPVLDQAATQFDDTGVINVPDGHVFVLGDNRDNAADSRLSRTAGGPGLIPLTAIRAVVAPPAPATGP